MIPLTEEQQREIKQGGWPPQLTDPTTGEVFVLIHKEMFERVRAVLEREDEIADVEEMYPLAAEVLDADETASREERMNQRGDVVYVEIPFYDRPGSKVRPAVVVQCDGNNRRLLSTLVAGITTNISRVGKEPTQFLIDPATPEGASSGLTQPSAAKCENLYTVSQARIRRTVGHLSEPLKQQLDDCLKAALELS